MAFVQTEGDRNASHNCFAYRIEQEYRSSDDGEPGGYCLITIQAGLLP